MLYSVEFCLSILDQKDVQRCVVGVLGQFERIEMNRRRIVWLCIKNSDITQI